MVGNKNKDKKWENMIRYKVKTRLITDLSPYKPVKKKEVFIVRENTDTGVWIPSKLSEFIVECQLAVPLAALWEVFAMAQTYGSLKAV